MAIQLLINDQEVEIGQDETIATDYAIAPIGKIETRSSSKSITFSIPKTALNKAVMDNIHIVNNNTTLPYDLIKARLYVDGIDQNIRYCEISSVKDVFSVRLYGGNVDFYALIKGLKLQDLDFGIYKNSVYQYLDNIADYTVQDGIFWPVIDYLTDSPNTVLNNTSNEYNVRYCFPCVSVEKILETIASNIGFTVSGSAIQDSLFQSCFLAPTGEGAEDVTDLYADGGQIDETDTRAINGGDFFQWLTDGTISGGWIVTGTKVIFDSGTGRLEAVLTSDVSIPSSGLSILKWTIISNTSTLNYTDADGHFTETSVGKVYTVTIQVCTENRLTDNDPIGVNIYIRPIGGLFLQYGLGTQYSAFLDLLQFLPDMNQADFLKAIVQKFGMILQVDNDTKDIEFKFFSDIVDNIPNALDWTDKIDFSNEEEIKFSFNDYGQINYARYKDQEDPDSPKPIGTDSSFSIPNKNLKAENNLFESPFTYTLAVTRFIGHRIPNIKLLTGVTSSGNFQDYYDWSSEPRILASVTRTGSIEYTDGITSVVKTTIPTGYFIESSLPSLGFADLLTYTQDLIDLLQAVKIVTIDIRLTASDINQLDFFKPIYIGQFNSYFYISKVRQFTATDRSSTAVELVKISN